MGLFDEQISRKPDNYPWTKDFMDAMWNGFWTANEFSFKSDYAQFKSELTPQEQQIITRTLASIGTIEIAVKKFWAKLGDNLPHPSISDLGFVLSNQEVIHNRAYEKLLEVLGLDKIFEEILEEPVIKNRMEYLRKYLKKVYKDDTRKQYVYAIILFSLFVENISLYSQFYIIQNFNKYKNILKDTSNQVSYTMQEEACFIDGTEIMTPFGWTKISDLKIGDIVYQYNKDGSFTKTPVLGKTEKHFTGKLVTFSRKGNFCAVTPDHDMVYYDVKGELRKRKASEMKFHKECSVPRTGELVEDRVSELSFLDRLRIAIQADGSIGKWKNSHGETKLRGTNGGFSHSISIRKKRKKERLEWILANAGVKYEKGAEDERGHVTYRIHLDHDFNLKRFNWVDLSDKGGDWCKEFINEIACWDGWVNEKGEAKGYCSKEKGNVDLVYLIAVLAGYKVKVIPKKDDRSDTFSDTWRLNFSKTRTFAPISHSIKKGTLEYNGKVSCITVSSGMILTKYKEETFIAGNCHALVGIKIINTLREEYPELFDADLECRILEETAAAVDAEFKIVDWVLGDYESENLSAPILKAYLANRMNESLQQIGFKPSLTINEEQLEKSQWFRDEEFTNTKADFFHRRPIDYSKNTIANDIDELF